MLTKSTSITQRKSVSITQRERQIIWAVSHGFNSDEISEKFFISLNTVTTHRKNIINKLKVRNTAHLIRKSFELGLIKADQHLIHMSEGY